MSQLPETRGFLGAIVVCLSPREIKTRGGPLLRVRGSIRFERRTGFSRSTTAESPTVEFIREGYDTGIKFFFSATYCGHGNDERLQ